MLVIAAVLALVAVGWWRVVGTPDPDGPASGSPSTELTTLTALIMATPIGVTLRVDDASAADDVFGVFRGVEERMNEWRAGSPLAAVNDAAGRAPVAVPADLRAVIRRALEIGAMTDGAFDVTWAALWGLWDFNADAPRVPADAAIAERLARVGFDGVIVEDDLGTVFLPDAGMLIGLGGIAKGYALDRAADALRARGVRDFLISAGGQVMAGGDRGDRPWRVGIRDPRGAADDFFAFLEVTDTSVSTSGDYERYFVVDGVRYHHILDPRTGRPARSGLRSATVVSSDATLADALSTAMVILGRERALELAEGLGGVEAVLVDDAGGVHVTAGLEGRLHEKHEPAK